MTPLSDPAQAQLFALLDRVPVGLYVFRLEDPPNEASLRIVFANAASGKVLGHDPAAVVGTLIGDFFPGSLGESGIAAANRNIVTTQEPHDFGVISYERVLAKAPLTRVVFTSGYSEDSSIQKLVQERRVSFIQKPYGGGELLAKIRASLGGADAS